MELSKIKSLNDTMYLLDTTISRDHKMMFIATLYLCTLNEDFRDLNKISLKINFMDKDINPINELNKIAIEELSRLKSERNINEKTFDIIKGSLNLIRDANTKLGYKRNDLKQFVEKFISDYLPYLNDTDNLFLETLYMEIDKKANGKDAGITLTPFFAAQLMVELAELDYKKDVVADLCSGTGLFSLLSYSKMQTELENDFKNQKISEAEHALYSKRIYNSIVANDIDPKMITLCLINFIIKSNLNNALVYSENVLKLEKSSFKYYDIDQDKEVNVYPTKGVLNPPYEDKHKPVEIIYKNISIIKSNNNDSGRVVVIVPSQLFYKDSKTFSKILTSASLTNVIKMQDDLFVESKTYWGANIFIFDLSKRHSKNDIIRYYDFSDSGYVYLKDSGLVDKNKTFITKKINLLNRISNKKTITTGGFKRNWNNFYDVVKEFEIEAQIDPDMIKLGGRGNTEADISLENVTIKKILKEKQALLDSVNNCFKDNNNEFENYIIDILSEDD